MWDVFGKTYWPRKLQDKEKQIEQQNKNRLLQMQTCSVCKTSCSDISKVPRRKRIKHNKRKYQSRFENTKNIFFCFERKIK